MGVETGTGAAASTGRAGIVITGASSGIGAACAIHLDRQGFRVFAGESGLSEIGRPCGPRLHRG